MAEPKPDIEKQTINGTEVNWSKSLGGPVTPIKYDPPVDDPSTKKLPPEGVELHPQVEDGPANRAEVLKTERAQAKSDSATPTTTP